ncbi:MAG: sugar transferase [Synergistaceae bacterium]|jgi:lipopolysaccharide/colanic/teichoic acid biosynthesis glycosyltransferase|nr:sugar transferase [Synergistaceae bacterium]
MTPYRIAKRAFDIALSLAGIICLSPLMIWIAVRVRREMGKNVIFRQERTGEGGKTFTLRKFRSMTDERDKLGELLPDEKRLPPFGKWLRATSLDELPQLWNVLKGDMSLVGPRPLLPEYVPLYSPSQKKRLEAPPGITGWAQINGRNAISWPEKFALDVWYVEHATFALDLKIMLMTIKKTFRREGISARGEATMTRFTGER